MEGGAQLRWQRGATLRSGQTRATSLLDLPKEVLVQILEKASWHGEQQMTSWQIEGVCKTFRELSQASSSVKLQIRAKERWWGPVVERLNLVWGSLVKLELYFVGQQKITLSSGFDLFDLPSELPLLTHLTLRGSRYWNVSLTQELLDSLLERLPHLTFLDVTDCQIEAGGNKRLLNALSNRLTSLCLNGPHSFEIWSASAVSQLQALTLFDIGRNYLSIPATANVVDILNGAPGLRTLNLSSVLFPSDGSVLEGFLITLGKLSNLTSLNLHVRPDAIITRCGRAIAKLTKLNTLILGGNKLVWGGGRTAVSCPDMVDALPKLTALTHLNILGVNLFDSASHVARLRELSTLSSLTLGGEGATTLDTVMLAALADLKGLRTLDIGGYELVVPGVDLSALGNLKDLTSFKLSGRTMTARVSLKDGNTSFLAQLSALTSLDLSGNRLYDSEAAVFRTGLQQMTGLLSLKLSQFFHESRGAETVAPALRKLTCLTYLDLSNNREGSAALVLPLRKLSSLTWLDLSYNQLFGGDEQTKSSFSRLASTLRMLPKLTCLRLKANCIGDVGASLLAPAIGELTRLETLELSSNAIGENGGIALRGEWRKLSSLQTFSINYCNALGLFRKDAATGGGYCNVVVG